LSKNPEANEKIVSFLVNKSTLINCTTKNWCWLGTSCQI